MGTENLDSEMVASTSSRRWVRPSTPEDAPAIITLMREAGLVPHVDTAHLQWKYWQARADWPGSRSFVLTDGRELLAHGAVMPGTLRLGSARAGAIHMIDWAARRNAVGAGVSLMKHVGGLTDFLFGIGGSAQTLKIMPLIGYRHCGTVVGYVRTLSPFALLRQPTGQRWKLGPRFVRSATWVRSVRAGTIGEWRSRRIEPNEVERIVAALPHDRPPSAFFERSPGSLRHALACPIVSVELFALERLGRIRGYFLLSFAPGQARLVDWSIDSDDLADRRALLELAVIRAKSRPGIAELVTWSSDPVISRDLVAGGFHERLTLPIYFRASSGLEVPTQGVRVQMLDNDAFYLHFDGDELWA